RAGPEDVPVGVRVGVTDSVGVGVGVGPTEPRLTRPILFVLSANQMLPSGPAAIPRELETVIWVVTTPEVVIRPIAVPAVYQSAPSGPRATSNAAAVGSVKCVMTPLVVMRSILPFWGKSPGANQSAPSGPDVMLLSSTRPSSSGTTHSVMHSDGLDVHPFN